MLTLHLPKSINQNHNNGIITLKISRVAENGRTAMPTSRSATAKLTMKKFVTLLNLCEQNTAAMTRQLPTITNTFINAKNASEIKFSSSVHCTESISVQLLIARPDYVGILDKFSPPVRVNGKKTSK